MCLTCQKIPDFSISDYCEQYASFAASAVAANCLVRLCAAAAFPLFGTQSTLMVSIFFFPFLDMGLISFHFFGSLTNPFLTYSVRKPQLPMGVISPGLSGHCLRSYAVSLSNFFFFFFTAEIKC